MKLALDFVAASDRGLVRGNNEDSAYAGPRLLALADGMGGHAAGEVASAFMIDALKPLDSPLIEDPEHSERLETLLATAMDEGNQNIAMHVQENPTLAGMGCTLTSLLFRGNEIGLCHVGDSRGYRLRDGELEQITTDDTFVQSLVEQGKLDPADVSSHPQRSLILKALTGRPVRHDVAMTGEITLRGEVLPIGGLKEKLLAALRGGMNRFQIPAAFASAFRSSTTWITFQRSPAASCSCSAAITTTPPGSASRRRRSTAGCTWR